MPDTTPEQARELAERMRRFPKPLTSTLHDAATALRSLADQVERVTGEQGAVDMQAVYSAIHNFVCANGRSAGSLLRLSGDERIALSRAVVSALPSLAAVTKERDALREALTPSGATKAAYIGEIKDSFVQYDEFGDEQYCTRPVSWDATKATMAMILARAALKETDQ